VFHAALGLAIGWGITPERSAAQAAGHLSGRVTYVGTGRGIAQVLVVVPDVGLGGLTDREGRFSIEGVPPGLHEITPTLVGCELASRTVEVKPDARVDVSFELSTPVINLQGLVVTAVASVTPDVDLPFSVGHIDGAQSTAGGSVGSLIQGRIAGARVLYGSGQPGSEPSIVLRAPSSIQRGQGPLVVIDGIITQGGVADINPLDVEDVEVLKGAAAAATYGARGEAGVLEIRTRRGPGTRTAGAKGPLVIVDGVATGATLADVDPVAIAAIRKFEGEAAAVLYGPQAERGVILVSTKGAPPEASRPPLCAVPRWIR
jgi:TonB-dependent SusC/RagA subfamily outer membrane receptor